MYASSDEVWDTNPTMNPTMLPLYSATKLVVPEMHEEKPWEHITHVPTTPPAI
jgi:hypothetical protein